MTQTAPERLLRVGALDLCVVDEGPRDGPVLLLLMGLGLQLTAWPQGWIDRLVGRGFRVLRLDHRDIGRSTPLDHLPTPSLAIGALRYAMGWPLPPPYALADLADDAVGVLDALGIARAQVLGVSMGGMVAQHLALRHPRRVSALHLWMTSPGGRWLPPPSARLRRLMLQRPRSRDAALAHALQLHQALAGPAYPSAEAELRQRIAASAARSWRPQATLRQLLAIAADGNRSSRLRRLPANLPVSIVHGSADPMLPPAHARALARALPQARLHWIDGWGHDLPAGLWDPLSQLVSPHT